VTRHPRVGALIEGLRDSGDEVVEINAPLPLDTAGRVAMLRQPWRLPVLAAQLARCWWRLYRRSRRLVPPPDAVLVGYLGHFDVRLARRLFRRMPIVLDHLVSAAGTAADRGLAGPSGIKARLLAGIDDGALRNADVVVVDTEEHRAALPPAHRSKAVVVPVGATAAWFAAPQDRDDHGARSMITPQTGPQAHDHLRVIFFGVFTPLHGTLTIGEALGLLKDDDIEVTMAGTGQEYAACRAVAEPNASVTWVDWIPLAQLPALVSAHDVCLGIFGTTPKALNVVPTKVYQGAAAGCAIVTSDTAPQRAAVPALFVPPGDAVALADALRSLARDRAQLAQLADTARAAARERFTAAAVVAPIRSRLKEIA
jgi:glycosyltransferase involved in cell wall biosynthesis